MKIMEKIKKAAFIIWDNLVNVIMFFVVAIIVIFETIRGMIIGLWEVIVEERKGPEDDEGL